MSDERHLIVVEPNPLLDVGHNNNPMFTGLYTDGYGWSLWKEGQRLWFGLFKSAEYPPSLCVVCSKPSTNVIWHDRFLPIDFEYTAPGMDEMMWVQRVLHYRCSDPLCRMAGGVRITNGGRMKADRSPTEWRVFIP